jgi:S-adenosylmethionine hydrolase
LDLSTADSKKHGWMSVIKYIDDHGNIYDETDSQMVYKYWSKNIELIALKIKESRL